jgi:hypothetical protein
MNRSDQYISATILGKEVGSSVDSIDSAAEGPAPLFFPLFGLIYEALATSLPDTSSRVDTVIACLGALKCLLDPRYSGKALLEPTIFQEFMSLSHRMAMTESAEVLVHLITVLTTFAKHFGRYVPGGDLRRVLQKWSFTRISHAIKQQRESEQCNHFSGFGSCSLSQDFCLHPSTLSSQSRNDVNS